jgi:hypothetical protein
MILTLQKYIFRELVRAFLLTAVALTCMLGFGGGVLDLLRSQGITAQEMLKLMVFLLPVVLTYSLPVAALFSTTITYGRFSSDNEINACRASGINIYRLLWPAVLMSVLVAGMTFVLENYTIPDLAMRIEQLVKRDMQSFAYMELKHKGYISKMSYALHCGSVDSQILPQLQPDGTLSPGQIQLSKVAFLRHEREIPVFYGTANTAIVLFENIENTPSVSIHMNQVRAFNPLKEEMKQVDYLPIGPIPIPAMTGMKIKFLSLPEILKIRNDPFTHKDLIEGRKNLYNLLKIALTYEGIINQYQEQGESDFADSKGRYSIRAQICEQNPKNGKITFKDVVLVNRLKTGIVRKFNAKEAVILVENVASNAPPTISIELREVRITEGKTQDPVLHKSVMLDGIPIPVEAIHAAEKININDLLSEKHSGFNYNENMMRLRWSVARDFIGIYSRCVSEIHSRTAYSMSALVLLLLGAGLGIIFRGGHFVSAFGLSFIPMLVVIVMLLMGKQLCTSATHQIKIGVVFIWMGLGIVGLANVVVLGRFMRR